MPIIFQRRTPPQYAQIGTVAGGGSSDPLIPRAPQAGDIFVDLDSSSNGSGSQASPYQKSQLTLTIWRSLVAGQQLVFVNASGSGSYTPIDLTSMPSGTSGSRIVVRTYPGHSQANLTFSTTGACHLGGDYWDFYNLKFTCTESGWLLGNCANAWYGDGARSGSSNFIRFIDCTGTNAHTGITDNSAIIGAGHNVGGNVCNGIDVLRCNFTGPDTGFSNRSLIWFDEMRICSIVGTYLQGSDNPFYFKHSDFTASTGISILVANNIIVGPSGRGCPVSSNWAVFRNNAFQNCQLYLDEDGGSTAPTSNNCTISHCTFLGADWFNENIALAVGRMINNTMMNNVMVGTCSFADAPFSSQDNGNVIDYSAVAGSGTNHYSRNHSSFTLASYHSTYSTQEANGIAGTLTLVGGTTPGATPANWALSPGSVGIGNASDGGDRGVDATKLLTVN